MAFAPIDITSVLDSLSVELLEKIAQGLELPELCNLRLTCKRLSDRCSGPRFKSFFECQRTDLTAASLHRLCQIAKNRELASAVRCVVVLAVVYDPTEFERMIHTKRRRSHKQQGVFSIIDEPQATKDELDEAHRDREQLLASKKEQEAALRDKSDLRILADALRHFGKLDRLATEALVAHRPGVFVAASSTREWRSVWIRASQVYHTAIKAIALSDVAIETLHVYKRSTRCSVPTCNINGSMPVLEAAGQHIKSISLSVSTKVETDPQKLADAYATMSESDRVFFEAGMGTQTGLLSEDNPAAVAEENLPGVARLLQQMPNLENLDLHLYNTMQGSLKCYAKVFTYIVYDVVLPSLQQCALRGVQCDEPSLLKFLRTHSSITYLELCNLNLTSGSYQPIFSHLLTMPSLQRLTLSNLSAPEKGRMNLFPKHATADQTKPGESWRPNNTDSFRCLGGLMVHTRTITREQMQREKFEFKEVR
ncbi:MAG: hypothetical protein Q9222_001610, partial [Ikaeria aurantiellina]